MLEYRNKEEFYIDAEYGEIPIGWTLEKLTKCFYFFPTASYSREKLTERGDCFYIHYGDIHTKFDVFLDFEKEKLPFVENKLARLFTKVKEGDLIIADTSEDYDGVGKAVEVLNIGNKTAIAGLHTLHLRAKDDCLINGFKAYVLNNGALRNKILRSATGIKVYSISKSSLKNVLIPIPPKLEQHNIASILSKVDQAIAATKNSLTKAERLKKALMQNLLTGKLKPDGTWRKGDEFQETNLGKIPTNWKIMLANQICFKVTDGTHDTPSQSSDGKPLVTSKNLTGDGINLNLSYLISEKNFIEINRRSRVDQYDILYGMIGTVGNPKIVMDEEVKFAIKNVGLFKTGGNFVLAQWLMNYLESPIYTMYLQRRQAGTTQSFVSLSFLRKLPVLVAIKLSKNEEEIDWNEIKLINDKLDKVNQILQSKKNKIKKLERLKKSLMQNLLTGKVRVKV